MQTFNAKFGLSKMSVRGIRSICETRATFRVACVQVFGKKLPTFKGAAEDFVIFSAFIWFLDPLELFPCQFRARNVMNQAAYSNMIYDFLVRG